MFSRLSKWFSGRQAPKGDAFAFADGLDWIRADDNPWGVDILDCRPIANGWLSATNDTAIAESFSALRQSDGRQHISAAPLPQRVEGSLKINVPVTPPEGVLFRSSRMEEKWDLYHWNGRLYAARSWTGELCYTGRITCEGDITTIDDIHTSRLDPLYAKKELHFLFVGICQASPMPAPLPVPDFPDPNNRAEKALAGSHLFSTFGCFGWFATVADLTEHRLIPPDELKPWFAAHPARSKS